MTIDGYANTPAASRYLQQICKHWGHRFTATFDEARGTVDFGDGSMVALEADSTTLVIRIDCEEAAGETMKEILHEHLDRFANRDGGVVVAWTPSRS